MGLKIKLDDVEYDAKDFSEQAKATLALLDFTTTHMNELTNMLALLQRSKNSYLDSLKREMLSSKSGFMFGDD